MSNDKLLGGIAAVAILAFAAVALVSAVAYSPYLSQRAQTNSSSYITVTASGSASAAPTVAQLYIYINGTGSTAQLATENLSYTVTAVNSTLSRYTMGNASDIQTTSYQLYKIPNSTAYAASESLLATLPLSSSGAALTDLSSIPDVYIGSIGIQLSQQQQAGLRSAALSIALANASSQAQQVAGPYASLHIKSVTINGAYYFTPGIYTAAVASSQIFGGASSVTQSVTVEYSYN